MSREQGISLRSFESTQSLKNSPSGLQVLQLASTQPFEASSLSGYAFRCT
jgi:hypothetical protein